MGETTTNSTLDSFELAGKPTSIEEVQEEATEAILSEYEQISRWDVAISINNQDSLLVGRGLKNADGFRLYHWPLFSEGSGIAGEIHHKKEFHRDGPNTHKLAFKPAGESQDDETALKPVDELTVMEHDRTDQLDQLLPHIRTELTDSDWVNGRGDAGYGEWISAVNELADFIHEYDDPVFAFPSNTVMQDKVMHAIARYPHDSDWLLTQTSDSIRNSTKNSLYECNPEAFRTILLDYAENNGLETEDPTA